jgi:Cu/Zn superoxide dismutase
MKLKTKLSVLVTCSALMLPTVVGAEAAVDPTNPSSAITTPPSSTALSIGQTNVNGVYITGNYVTNMDSRVAYIPGGVGLVVVDKGTALPSGSYYLDSVGFRQVELTNSKGASVGHATLKDTSDGVSLEVNVTGLTPGKHGFHIHQNSIVGNDFNTAGGHFNPENKQHGLSNPAGAHLGDMQNLEAQADGTGTLKTILKGVTLEPGKNNSLIGKSLMIHAAEDDGKTDPSGNSGDRIAGGNITQ